MSDVKQLWEKAPDRPEIPQTVIFYTTNQVAKLLETSVPTVKDFIYAGDLRACKLGNQWRIAEADLEVFVANLYGGA